MSEALYRIESVERRPGPLGFHLAVGVLGHVWPIAGMLLFGWDVLEVAFAYWGGLGAFLAVGVVRILPVQRWVAGFFALHGGIFWLASLQLVSELRAPGTTWMDIGWGKLLGIAALSGGTVLFQEFRYGRLEAAAGRTVEGLGLVGRYYWRFGLMAFLLFMVADVSPRGAGWLLVGISTTVDTLATIVGTLWPRRVFRNSPTPSSDGVAG